MGIVRLGKIIPVAIFLCACTVSSVNTPEPAIDSDQPSASIAVSTPTVGLPTSNSVYFGVVEGINSLFVTENYQQESFADSGFSTSASLGEVYFANGYINEVYPYAQFKQPRLLFTLSDLAFWDEPHHDFSNPEFLYASGVRGELPEIISFVYKIDMSTGEFQEVWSSQGTYSVLKSVDGGYLEIQVRPCYACDDPTPSEVLIVNPTSGASLNLGQVVDVDLSIRDQLVYFRDLIEVPCEDESCYIPIMWVPDEIYQSQPLP